MNCSFYKRNSLIIKVCNKGISLFLSFLLAFGSSSLNWDRKAQAQSQSLPSKETNLSRVYIILETSLVGIRPTKTSARKFGSSCLNSP